MSRGQNVRTPMQIAVCLSCLPPCIFLPSFHSVAPIKPSSGSSRDGGRLSFRRSMTTPRLACHGRRDITRDRKHYREIASRRGSFSVGLDSAGTDFSGNFSVIHGAASSLFTTREQRTGEATPFKNF